MKNNLKKNKIKILLTFVFLLMFLFLIQNLSSKENDLQTTESVDFKLGQLSDTSKNITEGVVEGDVVENINRNQTQTPVKKIAKSTSEPVSSFGGVSGVDNCGLTLNFKLDNASFSKDSNSNYTMYIKNEGREKCSNASISVYYSNNQSFVSSNPKPSASNYYWVLGDMESGDLKTILFSTSYKEGDISSDTIQTEACATADDSEDACASITSNLTQGQTLSLQTAPDTVEKTVVPAVYTTSALNTSFNPDSKEYGTWVWTSPYAMSTSYRDKVIAGSVANNINTIYITIDDYLNINSLPAGIDKETKKKKYSEALQGFIVLANKNNIQVDVEAGWRDWAEVPNTNKANVIIDYAIEYNNTYTNKIRGIQFDVEPYLLSSYEKNKGPVLTNFVNFVANVSNRLGSNKLALSIVIPHFYDSSQKWTPAVNYNGTNDYTFNHLLNILDKRPGSSIILMSYRNTAEGTDGSIKISKTEVDQASSGGYSTKVIVAQETGNVEPGYVTFYKTSKDYYIKQINIINNEFKNKVNFGGISVHYIDPFLEL